MKTSWTEFGLETHSLADKCLLYYLYLYRYFFGTVEPVPQLYNIWFFFVTETSLQPTDRRTHPLLKKQKSCFDGFQVGAHLIASLNYFGRYILNSSLHLAVLQSRSFFSLSGNKRSTLTRKNEMIIHQFTVIEFKTIQHCLRNSTRSGEKGLLKWPDKCRDALPNDNWQTN